MDDAWQAARTSGNTMNALALWGHSAGWETQQQQQQWQRRQSLRGCQQYTERMQRLIKIKPQQHW
jgi:hypothetical protein